MNKNIILFFVIALSFLIINFLILDIPDSHGVELKGILLALFLLIISSSVFLKFIK